MPALGAFRGTEDPESPQLSLSTVQAYATQLKPLETQFGRPMADRSLLDYEVEWELPPPGT